MSRRVGSCEAMACLDCGLSKPEAAFHVKYVTSKGRRYAYRANRCHLCIGTANRAKYATEPEARERNRLNARRYYRANRQRVIAREAALKRRKSAIIKPQERVLYKKRRAAGLLPGQTLSDSYIGKLLCVFNSNAPGPLIELKRAHLSLKRELRTLRETSYAHQ